MKVDNIVLVFSIFAIAAMLITSGCPSALIIKSNSEREAEVKSNIHEIQIALERYAVDTGGIYPTFLVGAEKDSNIIFSSMSLSGNGVSQFPEHGVTPFAMSYHESGEPLMWITSDPLIHFGYLSEYPTNPFATECAQRFTAESVDAESQIGIFPYAGIRGDKMFDLGFGWGDTPQTDFVIFGEFELQETREARISGGTIFADPDLDAPGNFYYHPIFVDLIPVYYHYAAQYDVIHNGPSDWSWNGREISEHRVIAYNLFGYGAPGFSSGPEEGGFDYFSRMPLRTHLPTKGSIDGFLPDGLILNSSVGYGEPQDLLETTGYHSLEFDPWANLFSDGIDPSNPSAIPLEKSGPDGVNDWVLIEVASGRDSNHLDGPDHIEN